MNDLHSPFPFSAHKWRIMASNKDKTKGLLAYYIDARDVMDRLDEVVEHGGWSDTYTVLTQNPWTVECMLVVNGTAKSDVGDGDAAKDAYSDAIKRAAVKHGVGRYLYGLPSGWFETEGQGNYVKFTAQAEQKIRAQLQRALTGLTAGELQDLGIDVNMDDVDEDPALAVQHRPPPKKQRKDSTNGKSPTPEPRPQGAPFAWPDSRSNEGQWLLSVATEFSPDNESAANFAEWFSNMSADSGNKKWSTSSTRPDGKEGQGQYGLAVWKLDDRYGKDSHRYILSSLMSQIVDKDFPDTIPGFKTKDIFDWLKKPDEWTNRLGAFDEYVEELKTFLLSMLEDAPAISRMQPAGPDIGDGENLPF